MPLGTLLNAALSSVTSFSLRRHSSLRSSLRSFGSSSSHKKDRTSSSYHPYAVYEQKMQPIILRDPDATNKLFEAIHDSPNGKRALSRLARTCRALCEPALNVLWREVDSLVPILWQFPGHLLKKVRKPGMGFVKSPSEEDWKGVFKYSDRVRQITYNENSNNVAASIFQVLEDTRPHAYILPHLVELNWKAETPAGLDRCAPFLNPELRAVNLEIGTKIPQLSSFLADMSRRTKLTTFSFVSPTNLPDAFTELLLRQDRLERVVLVAPGALAPGIGRWIASLPRLKSLRLDLTGRSMIAVEGFFDELRLRSGDSTPSSVGTTDSGVFSEDEVDFSLIRKSALRLTGDLRSKGSFAQMRKLQLTGEVSNIAVFIKHLRCPLTQLELVIEDPPDRADWHDLSDMICDKFADSLQSLKVTATGSSRFMDLVRSTSRAEPATGRLSMEHFTNLPNLTRLDIDLPESVIFTDTDIQSVAKACPNLEVLKLCPLARFPSTIGAPKVTLDSVAHLLIKCRRLHTLAVVIDAKGGKPDILRSRITSSKSLLRLHFGHSWINDSLQVAILLSHLAPHLETLKWFQEKNRPGFIEAHARNWQGVAELLPHLQNIRHLERGFVTQIAPPVRPDTAEKSIDAVVRTVERGVHASPRTSQRSVQFSPVLVSQVVEAKPETASMYIDATPATVDVGVEATTVLVDREVEALPPTASEPEDASPSSVVKAVQALLTPTTFKKSARRRVYSAFLILPSIFGLFSLAFRLFIYYPLSLPSRILHMAVSRLRWKNAELAEFKPQVSSSLTPANIAADIPLDNLQVRQ